MADANGLRQMLAEQLLTHGRKAAKKGDRATVRACIAVLEGRHSRKAIQTREELEALLRAGSRSAPSESATPARSGRAAAAKPSASTVQGGLVFDRDNAARRLDLIANAKSSILLSSLTFPNAETVAALVRRGKAGVRVRLVVAERQVQDHHHSDIRRLTKAGANIYAPRSTHSKCLVIDERVLMIGSANAHGGDRDIGHIEEDPTKARQLLTYFDDLVSPLVAD